MAQSLGVQETQQKRDRSRVGLGPVVILVAVTAAALFLAPVIWTGNTPAVRPTPNPVSQVAPTTPQVSPISYGQWVNSAKAAGFTGRLGGTAAATTEGGVNFTEKLKPGRA